MCCTAASCPHWIISRCIALYCAVRVRSSYWYKTSLFYPSDYVYFQYNVCVCVGMLVLRSAIMTADSTTHHTKDCPHPHTPTLLPTTTTLLPIPAHDHHHTPPPSFQPSSLLLICYLHSFLSVYFALMIPNHQIISSPSHLLFHFVVISSSPIPLLSHFILFTPPFILSFPYPPSISPFFLSFLSAFIQSIPFLIPFLHFPIPSFYSPFLPFIMSHHTFFHVTLFVTWSSRYIVTIEALYRGLLLTHWWRHLSAMRFVWNIATQNLSSFFFCYLKTKK